MSNILNIKKDRDKSMHFEKYNKITGRLINQIQIDPKRLNFPNGSIEKTLELMFANELNHIEVPLPNLLCRFEEYVVTWQDGVAPRVSAKGNKLRAFHWVSLIALVFFLFLPVTVFGQSEGKRLPDKLHTAQSTVQQDIMLVVEGFGSIKDINNTGEGLFNDGDGQSGEFYIVRNNEVFKITKSWEDGVKNEIETSYHGKNGEVVKEKIKVSQVISVQKSKSADINPLLSLTENMQHVMVFYTINQATINELIKNGNLVFITPGIGSTDLPLPPLSERSAAKMSQINLTLGYAFSGNTSPGDVIVKRNGISYKLSYDIRLEFNAKLSSGAVPKTQGDKAPKK